MNKGTHKEGTDVSEGNGKCVYWSGGEEEVAAVRGVVK